MGEKPKNPLFLRMYIKPTYLILIVIVADNILQVFGSIERFILGSTLASVHPLISDQPLAAGPLAGYFAWQNRKIHVA